MNLCLYLPCRLWIQTRRFPLFFLLTFSPAFPASPAFPTIPSRLFKLFSRDRRMPFAIFQLHFNSFECVHFQFLCHLTPSSQTLCQFSPLFLHSAWWMPDEHIKWWNKIKFCQLNWICIYIFVIVTSQYFANNLESL